MNYFAKALKNEMPLLREPASSGAPRLRRLRQSPGLRDMLQETRLSVSDFVYPLFIEEEITDYLPINSLPGIKRIPEKFLAREIEAIAKAGIKAVMLFGVSHKKDASGSDTWNKNGLLARMVRIAKDAAPNLIVMADTCFCEYTDHGHCGVVVDGHVHNDITLENLGKQAVVAAEAGADIIAPSCMMDGQVRAIRMALDAADLPNTSILSYSTKFASSFYGPFREASGCQLKGDRKTYQMNPMNPREAVRESLADEAEGADMLMVKPALAYLDIISEVRRESRLPLGAYQVSGEYAMIKFAAQAGALNEGLVVRETLGAIKRAGADFIFTYFAMDLAKEGI
jgi:porphobilinogen synthase